MLATQFLFSRFAPKSHAYSILVLLKSFILAMVPVVFQAGVVLQSCFLGFAIALFMMHQQYVRPWKSETANQMDGLCSVTLQLLLLCGALASPIDSSTTDELRIVGTGVFVFLVLVLGASVAVSLYRVCVPGPRYKWFICHHKAREWFL
ncbi:ANK1 [Symbiodinium pilosum]|uniref:ANK1 protein n=1 Tax=Symbiodinium pilosum TaxID=2952 RepID=A0A812XSC1_SYMPI|nr:ANK1 [Symbiodinium pilosum]